MNTKRLLPILSSVVLASLSLNVQAAEPHEYINTKSVGNAVWHKQSLVNPQNLINQSVPQQSASIFFIRRSDNDSEQSSANIAINDRFQVSLQPGNYTQVMSCAGTNNISAEITGRKTNDLSIDAKPYNLAGGGTYFFYVDIDEQKQVHIQQITKTSALGVLQDKRYQSHQISRVVPNCPLVETPLVVQPLVQVAPQPVQETVVLEEPVSITLEVLFDNDQAVIKPQYFSEVSEVAKFMNQYGNSIARIEGHTDSNADAAYNQRLSEQRAYAVAQMLTQQYGISPNRIQAIGYGESRPIASNDTAIGRQQNRRVVAVVEERQ